MNRIINKCGGTRTHEAKITEMSVCTGAKGSRLRSTGGRNKDKQAVHTGPRGSGSFLFPWGQEEGCDGKKEQSPPERAGSKVRC